MGLLRLFAQIAAAVTSVTGYVLAAVFTINPPTTDGGRQRDLHLVIGFGIVFVLLVVGLVVIEYFNDKRRQALNELRETERESRIVQAVSAVAAEVVAARVKADVTTATDVIPEPHDVATPFATSKPGRFKIDLFELGEADRAAEAAGDETSAAKRFRALQKPAGLRQQAFELVNAVREALTEYHGAEEIDSFVSPEIGRTFTKRLLAVKNKIEKFLHRRILRKESQFPVTVRRMRMFLDDVEQGAAGLKDDIPPVV